MSNETKLREPIDPFNLIWRTNPQFWSDRDVFKRWQDSLVALHELITNDAGEEIALSPDEERRLQAALNVTIASVELVFRSLDNQVAKLRKELGEMELAATMSADELMTVVRSLMPSAVDREQN